MIKFFYHCGHKIYAVGNVVVCYGYKKEDLIGQNHSLYYEYWNKPTPGKECFFLSKEESIRWADPTNAMYWVDISNYRKIQSKKKLETKLKRMFND